MLFPLMVGLGKREALILLAGDIVIFALSLWLALFFRYGELPNGTVYGSHLTPFLLVFTLSVLVFFIAGLYEKHTVILKSRLPSIILRAQLVNSFLAVLFFYLAPYFGITPKTNLFIYLVISFGLILLWRLYGLALFGFRKKQNAIIVGSGTEMKELFEEVNNNTRYNLRFISSVDLDKMEAIDFQEEILNRVYSEEVSVVAVDLRSEKVESLLPHLYNLIFSKVRFIDTHKIYEDIFDRVPLSLLQYTWFLENISLSPKFTFDFLKRLMDIAFASVLVLISLLFYPFVWLAIKLDDGGTLWSVQERIGQNSHLIKLLKFRTMEIANDGGQWNKDNQNKVTRVGNFLRKTRIDELPQLWNVLKGDISLIGPRPEFPKPVKLYEKQVPYYGVRHLIKPGLSGWAQIHHDEHPHHTIDMLETKNKLSYDLYYIKNRSMMLDLKIALRTIKTLLSRSGV
ncbi:MAG: sugar transferase [Parcubacteria group bacterium GW2011_GWB1_44_7]|nr:MAG: sugar transferase [Parcubacteria group bacterium GW2011_GWB1_44_7]